MTVLQVKKAKLGLDKDTSSCDMYNAKERAVLCFRLLLLVPSLSFVLTLLHLLLLRFTFPNLPPHQFEEGKSANAKHRPATASTRGRQLTSTRMSREREEDVPNENSEIQSQSLASSPENVFTRDRVVPKRHSVLQSSRDENDLD